MFYGTAEAVPHKDSAVIAQGLKPAALEPTPQEPAVLEPAPLDPRHWNLGNVAGAGRRECGWHLDFEWEIENWRNGRM